MGAVKAALFSAMRSVSDAFEKPRFNDFTQMNALVKSEINIMNDTKDLPAAIKAIRDILNKVTPQANSASSEQKEFHNALMHNMQLIKLSPKNEPPGLEDTVPAKIELTNTTPSNICLQEVLTTLENHNYILNYGGKTIGNKKYAKSASNVVKKITEHFLKNGNDTAADDELLEDIQRELAGKVNPTNGFLFWHIGARDKTTADLYRGIVEKIELALILRDLHQTTLKNS